MERIMVKKGEPIRIVIQPKKIEIVEHRIITERPTPTNTDTGSGNTNQ